ncbi:hypothetical protein B0H13DRAFT_2279018 [Mycena leptocephala]|nr:hypothetical protein B0H13DRAFT_2279018 [Mycena leptocephala]
MEEKKGMGKTNVRDGVSVNEVAAKGGKRASRAAKSAPNHAGGASRERAGVYTVRGKIEAIAMKREWQSSVGVSTDSFVQRPSSKGRKMTVEGAGYTARTDEGVETKTPCSTRSVLHQNRRASAQSPDGTSAQRIDCVKEGWHGQARDRNARPPRPPHAGKCPLRRNSRTETRKREPPKFRIHTNNKERKDRQRSSLTPETTAHFHRSMWPWPVRPRAQRRHARAVVLRLMRVAVADGDARALVEGRSSRKEHGPRRVGVC